MTENIKFSRARPNMDSGPLATRGPKPTNRRISHNRKYVVFDGASTHCFWAPGHQMPKTNNHRVSFNNKYIVLGGASQHGFWAPGNQMPKIEESPYKQ